MQIRQIGTADEARWMQLRRALFEGCSEERHRLEIELFKASGGIAFLAETPGGEAVGFAEVSIRRDHVPATAAVPVPYLEAWYVAPEHRGRGVGRALVEEVVRWAAEAGFSELASDTDPADPAAINAHLGLGFREVDRSVHFLRPVPGGATAGPARDGC